VSPAWGLNPRGYGKYFRSSRLDILRNQALLRLIPGATFSADSYYRTGKADYFEAIKIWAQACGLIEKPLWSCAVEGMWGGYLAIRRAREYLRKQLILTRWTLENITEYLGRVNPDCLQVALHIRRGDFLPPESPNAYQGRFNIAIPGDWYMNIARSIQCSLGCENVQFTVVSDGHPGDLAPYKNDFSAITTDSQNHRDISDLLILASADILVCSISSYSTLAAFLSKGLYLWYEPQMSTMAREFYSLWGDQDDQKAPSSPTQQHLRMAQDDRGAAPRGIPVRASGRLSDSTLAAISAQRHPAYCDLIQYGTARCDE
jgi:hypothetical protein